MSADKKQTEEKTVWKKNDTAVIRIEDIGRDGEGIGHISGYTVFVKDTVPGDLAEICIVKAGKQYGYGRLLQVKEPSAFRVEAPCPVARQCGGCQLQMMDYKEQLRWKEKKVRDDLERIGGYHFDSTGSGPEKDCAPNGEPISGMDNPWRYRNKALFPIGTNRDGQTTAGFYAGRTHAIISCSDCLLGTEENQPLLQAVLEWMEDCHITPYEEKTGKGLVRHVLIRKGYHTGDLHVCLVINGTRVPAGETLVKYLRRAAPDSLTGVTFSSNTTRGNTVMGKRAQIIWGSGYLTDRIVSEKQRLSVSFRISPNSFYQVNPVQTARLYEQVLEYADLTGNEIVADLYCGIGTISLFLAARAKRVVGVEIVPEAVEDARENARINGIRNAEFFTGKAEELVPELAREGLKPDVVIVDPPRKGCDQRLLETICRMSPEKLIYVSCDPATLARDLAWLEKQGFRLQKYRPFDQFPMTVHVETVVLMSKVNTVKG